MSVLLVRVADPGLILVSIEVFGVVVGGRLDVLAGCLPPDAA
jgi:hypothetical protein